MCMISVSILFGFYYYSRKSMECREIKFVNIFIYVRIGLDRLDSSKYVS